VGRDAELTMTRRSQSYSVLQGVGSVGKRKKNKIVLSKGNRKPQGGTEVETAI
jgi:hypothetical protein